MVNIIYYYYIIIIVNIILNIIILFIIIYRYAVTTILLRKVHILTRDLTRNYMCSLMMISDMLSKHVGAVKSVLKK